MGGRPVFCGDIGGIQQVFVKNADGTGSESSVSGAVGGSNAFPVWSPALTQRVPTLVATGGLLGTAAALPDPDRRHTAILLTLDNGRHVLVDCGHGATTNMIRPNVNPAAVGLILLTHLHQDHISDLPFFLLERWILNRVGSPVIIGPKGTAHFVKCMLEGGAYDVDIRARARIPSA